MRGRESERGHPVSRLGRASRAEKFLKATAPKNVLGRVLSWAPHETSNIVWVGSIVLVLATKTEVQEC